MMPPESYSLPNDSVEARRIKRLQSKMAPLLPYMDNSDVTDILLNDDGRIWIDGVSKGMQLTDTRFTPHEAELLIRDIASHVGAEIHDTHPWIDAKLPLWNARFHGSLPPIYPAPIFAIRKPAKRVFTLEDYVARGMMTPVQADLLTRAVHDKKNILVGGSTGAGKTTLCNALLHVMSTLSDRIFIVEDTPELHCEAPNKVQALVSPPHFTFRHAVMSALRLRPDRIVVGEVRDGAALDLLKAWNTGHPGGLATIHANDPQAMLNRMVQLIEEVVVKASPMMVAESIQVCVHITRDPHHPARRRISGICEVRGWKADEWLLTPIGNEPGVVS